MFGWESLAISVIEARWKRLSYHCRQSPLNWPISFCVVEISIVFLTLRRCWYWLVTVFVHQDFEVKHRSLILGFRAEDNCRCNFLPWQQRLCFAQSWHLFRMLTDVCSKNPWRQPAIRPWMTGKFLVFCHRKKKHCWILVAGCSTRTDCHEPAEEFFKENLDGQGKNWPQNPREVV